MRASPEAASRASAYARLALDNIEQEYPNKPDHVIRDGYDLRAPRQMHPVFFGSFDWHSSVHMHWTLARLLRCFPDLPERSQICSAFDRHFLETNVAAEIAYVREPERGTFERTYGWAWLLKLQAELTGLASTEPYATTWRDALGPLATEFAERYQRFLPLAKYPIRSGTHANSAFGLLFALDYAECTQHIALRKLVAAKSHAWFGRDRRYPAAYEPGGEDFLSSGLLEAVLMQRLIDACSFADWWEVFCPASQELLVWLMPVAVSDRTDGKLAHLDGLNLARAWCWHMLRPHLPEALHAPVLAAIEAHLAAALPHAADGNYAGTHWLASFALLALTDGGD